MSRGAWRSAGMMPGLVALLAAACGGGGGEVADLTLNLVPVAEPDPFGAGETGFKVATLDLRGTVDGQLLFRTTVDYDHSGALPLPDLTLENDDLGLPRDSVIITLSGYNEGGTMVAQGSTGLLRLAAGQPATASMIFARVESCSRLEAGLARARWGHTATALPDGRVLVVGGAGTAIDGVPGEVLSSYEIFEPQTGAFTLHEADGLTGRVLHTATSVDAGVLVVGGLGQDGQPLGTAALFDSNGVLSVEFDVAPRAAHAAAPFEDGVLVAGGVVEGAGLASIPGFVRLPVSLGPTDTVQLVRPSSRDAVDKPVLPGGARAFPVAVSLGDGTAVVGGGVGASGTLAQLDWYPISSAPSSVGQLPAARHSASALTFDERALIIGGVDDAGQGLGSGSLLLTATVEGEPPVVTPSATEMTSGRGGFGMASLTGDRAVALAGLSDGGASPVFANRAELYDPSAGFSASGPLRVPRTRPAVVRLADGVVLAIGGLTPGGGLTTVIALDSVEVYRARQELP